MGSWNTIDFYVSIKTPIDFAPFYIAFFHCTQGRGEILLIYSLIREQILTDVFAVVGIVVIDVVGGGVRFLDGFFDGISEGSDG